jgi:hypothetical protein
MFEARMKRDQDVEWFDRMKLKSEIKRLRNAIRQHRDQKLDDRCWMDDYELYEVLPEGIDPSYVDLRLLPKEEMRRNCDRFIECRTTSLTPAEAIEKYKDGSDIR